MLQVDLVALENLVGVLGPPPDYHPHQVVLDHGDSGVRHVALLHAESSVKVIAETLRQLPDDYGAVRYFFPVELDERQLAFLGAELQLVVNILKQKESVTYLDLWCRKNGSTYSFRNQGSP